KRLAGEPNGNKAKQRHLGEWTAIIKIRTGLTASADGLDPVPGMPLDARDFFRRRVFAGVLLHEGLRQQVAVGATVRTVAKHPLFAEENRPGAGNLLVSGEILWSGNRGDSVMPDEFDRAARFSGGKLEGDLCAWRVGQAMLHRIVVGHLG